MYHKKKIPKKYIFLFIIVVLLLFLGIASQFMKEDRKLNGAEKWLRDSGLWVQKMVSTPVRFIEDRLTKEKKTDINKDEIENLQKKALEYDALQAKKDSLENEIADLKATLELNKTLNESKKVSATIVERNFGYWYQTLVIDKGEKEGIQVGMAVLNAQGLLGKVIQTSNHTSTVKLITASATNKISVQIKVGDQTIYGLLSSYDLEKKVFYMEGISGSIKPQEGDLVATSGLGDLFPSGLLVGKVSKITTDHFDLASLLEVKTDVDFNHLNYVTVVSREG